MAPVTAGQALHACGKEEAKDENSSSKVVNKEEKNKSAGYSDSKKRNYRLFFFFLYPIINCFIFISSILLEYSPAYQRPG